MKTSMFLLFVVVSPFLALAPCFPATAPLPLRGPDGPTFYQKLNADLEAVEDGLYAAMAPEPYGNWNPTPFHCRYIHVWLSEPPPPHWGVALEDP